MQVFDEHVAILICYQFYWRGWEESKHGIVNGFIGLFFEEHFETGEKLIDLVHRLDEIHFGKFKREG